MWLGLSHSIFCGSCWVDYLKKIHLSYVMCSKLYGGDLLYTTKSLPTCKFADEISYL